MALLLNPAPFMPAAQQPHLALSIIYSFQFTKGKSPKSQTSSVLFSTSPNKMWWLLTRVVSVVPSLRTAGAVTVTEFWVMKNTVGIQQNRIQGWIGFHLKEVSSSQDLCVSATMVSWGPVMNYHNSVWNWAVSQFQRSEMEIQSVDRALTPGGLGETRLLPCLASRGFSSPWFILHEPPLCLESHRGALPLLGFLRVLSKESFLWLLRRHLWLSLWWSLCQQRVPELASHAYTPLFSSPSLHSGLTFARSHRLWGIWSGRILGDRPPFSAHSFQPIGTGEAHL